MTALTLAGVTALIALPREFHIDCSGWPGAAVTEIHFRFTPAKGKRIDTFIEMQPKTDPADVRRGIERTVRDAGWRYRTVGKGILVLEGAKESPIRSVEFKSKDSKDWKPDVRVVYLVP